MTAQERQQLLRTIAHLRDVSASVLGRRPEIAAFMDQVEAWARIPGDGVLAEDAMATVEVRDRLVAVEITQVRWRGDTVVIDAVPLED